MFDSKRSVIDRYSLPYSSHGSHAKIASMVGIGWKVLDVGCAIGSLGKYLKETKNCHVVGIEIDKNAAEIARNIYDKVIIGDVEELQEIVFSNEYFDAIILADILEHLARPDILLVKLKRYLKPEGYVIASIPNIAQLEIRLKLLFGKFEYEETGILDRTHLRFFTLKTAKELFHEVGYEVILVDYTGLRSKYHVLKFIPKLFAYQFIITARPR